MRDGDLRSIFKRKLPSFHWQSIETSTTGRGIPDSNYCCKGVEGWIEYKYTSGFTIDLRPEQVAWLARRARAGGRVWIAVRRQTLGGARSSAVDQLWLFHGGYAADLKQGGIKNAPASAVAGWWEGGSGRWNWGEVESALIQL